MRLITASAIGFIISLGTISKPKYAYSCGALRILIPNPKKKRSQKPFFQLDSDKIPAIFFDLNKISFGHFSVMSFL